MNRPSMSAEQSNIPKNEEERQAALQRKEIADAAEEAAHKAARERMGTIPPDIAKAIETQMAKLQAYMYQKQELEYDIAVASGTIQQHVNTILFAAAVCVANAKTPEDEKGMVNYITTESARLRHIKTTKGSDNA